MKQTEALGKVNMAHQVLELIEDFYQSSHSPDVRLLACSVRSLLRQAEKDYDELSERQHTKDPGEGPEEKHEEQSS